MTTAPKLVAEKLEHAEAIEAVLDRAFGPGRLAKTSERVRERGAIFEPSLSRVALNENEDVIGCCRIWRVSAGARDVFFLGPLAVEPGQQHHGLGAALTRASVAACRSSGGHAIVLVGAAAFFSPIGFFVVPDGRIELPGPVDPKRLMWIELKPGGLDGVQGMLSPPRGANRS